MADRGYTFELLEGIATYLAGQPHAGAAGTLATYRAAGGGDYTAEDVRPVYWRTGSEQFDELWQLIAGRPMLGPNNGITTPVQFLYRGTRNGPDRAGLAVVDSLMDAFRPNGRPLVHHAFGLVRIGQVVHESSGQLPNDPDNRVRFSMTYQFRGKRYTGS